MNGVRHLVVVVPLLLTLRAVAAGSREIRVPTFPMNGDDQHGGTGNCTLKWFETDADHFSWGTVGGGKYDQTFSFRYYEYDAYYGGPGHPIWFYAGNEARVDQYVNATGLMWENAKEHGALLVFAEHRFYGDSFPCGDEENAKVDCLYLLTHEQAMADYVALLSDLKSSLGAVGANDSPVIAFGGSYGGMLAAWLRMKYPSTIAGAVSASGPILGFPGLPFYEQNERESGASYWDIVEYDMSSDAGADSGCAAALTLAFELVADLSSSEEGRSELEVAFGLCPGVLTSDLDGDGLRLQNRILLAYDDYAMGNYPFSSNYLSGTSPLPPFPMRAACKLVAHPADKSNEALLAAAGASVNLLYNASGDVGCFDSLPPRENEGEDGIWEAQWCSEYMCQETYFTRRAGGVFPEYIYNATWVSDHCMAELGPTWKPRTDWISRSYYGASPGNNLQPGYLPVPASASNIIFSNGEYDPWRAAGVTATNDSDRDVTSVIVSQGAHHLDLMFATPDDPPGLAEVRELEISMAAKWAAESRRATLRKAGSGDLRIRQ